MYIENYWLFYSNHENTWMVYVGQNKASLKQVQHSAAFSQIHRHNIYPDDFQQSILIFLRIIGYTTITVKIQWLVERNAWYQYAEVLCNLKELICDIINQLKSSRAFSQINWPKSFLDDLQHTISMMYIESYWLRNSNRENTLNDLCGSK